MREILFRGKNIKGGQFIYGDLRQDKDLETTYISGYSYYAGTLGTEREPFEYEVDPDTVGQYTGIKDINREQIFDGDIISIQPYTLENAMYKNAIVKWCSKSASFQILIGSEIRYFDEISNEAFEVIGNIYDNPNLV